MMRPDSSHQNKTLDQSEFLQEFSLNRGALLSLVDLFENNKKNPTTLYSLRKRLFFPRWWLDGYIFKYGTRVQLLSVLKDYPAQYIAVGPDLPAKYVNLVLSIWHELVLRNFNGSSDKTVVHVPLTKILKRLSEPLSDTVAFLENYWTSPYRVHSINEDKIKKDPSNAWSSGGAFNFVQAAFFEKIPEPVLTFRLNFPLRSFCAGTGAECIARTHLVSNKNNTDFHLLNPNFVSANPDVIKIYSAGSKLKNVLPYLLLECAKSNSILPELHDWSVRSADSTELCQNHKNLVRNAKNFYDHGVLGWSSQAPEGRISSLKKAAGSSQSRIAGKTTFIHCLKFSPQSQAAEEYEKALDSGLERTEFPIPQRPSRRSDNDIFPSEKDEILESQTEEHAPRFGNPEPIFIENSEQVEHLTREETEHDFLLQVANFYESLNQSQKTAFDNQRMRMSHAEFKAYMLPALKNRN